MTRPAETDLPTTPDLLTTALLDGAAKDDVPPERETDIQRALSSVGDWLAAERLTADIRKYGIESAPTYEVQLRDAEGALCSRSSGKGLGHRSMASALFESAEHYHLDWRRDPRAAEAEFRPGRDIAGQATARRSALLRRLGGIMPDSPVLTRAYRPVEEALTGRASDAAGHRHPVFLRDGGYRNWPHPDDDRSFQPLWHYTSSAGYAAGATLHEALVHAVNELIERDAWSYQLARSYFGLPGEGPELRVVDHDSLPAELRELTGTIEEVRRAPVLIVSIACDTGVPAYVVCDAESREDVRLIGSGASPVRTYALQRALLEYLQVRTMFEHGPVDADTEAGQIATALARYPRHLAAARFDIHRLPHEMREFDADDGLPLLPAAASPEELLRHLVERLREVGVDVHYRVLTPPGSVTVVDVVAPGLEMFDKARAGYPVLPTGRLGERLRPGTSGGTGRGGAPK
ncbi:YcaO-like family protein [Streptomyces ipomoeae]|uniref:YcaO-like family protein n=1 Tax=Streptomyces ipomoeae TaxID=103232 RepID=UPI00215CB922|nr:YcaO-like family protein [Streptomyces ipomoeae]MDX2825931.1 YcaO-like family protein [Streptomyces ipomoeae]MDX2878494.1 YcaO-like family protein [Streptomyces ipomoeae]